ncbi:MAG: hypothetical protein QNJ16_22100, partial [Rhodobacter sp.]|nr:hypothetical protein [Rhodobacter sp.]
NLIATAVGATTDSDIYSLDANDLASLTLTDSNGNNVPITIATKKRILGLASFAIRGDGTVVNWTTVDHTEYEQHRRLNPSSTVPRPVAPTIDATAIAAAVARSVPRPTSARDIAHAVAAAVPPPTTAAALLKGVTSALLKIIRYSRPSPSGRTGTVNFLPRARCMVFQMFSIIPMLLLMLLRVKPSTVRNALPSLSLPILSRKPLLPRFYANTRFLAMPIMGMPKLCTIDSISSSDKESKHV